MSEQEKKPPKPKRERDPSAHHLNGDIICAIDIETTGLDPDLHDIFEIALIPLDAQYEPSKLRPPLSMTLRPDRHHNIDWDGGMRIGTKNRILNALKNGIDPFQAADYLAEWKQKLGLPELKRIVPLAHNWAGIDKPFILKWLGPHSFGQIFSHHYRDTMVSALFWNDRSDIFNEPYRYPHIKLVNICTRLGIERDGQIHCAMQDAYDCARAYKKMLQEMVFTI